MHVWIIAPWKFSKFWTYKFPPPNLFAGRTTGVVSSFQSFLQEIGYRAKDFFDFCQFLFRKQFAAIDFSQVFAQILVSSIALIKDLRIHEFILFLVFFSKSYLETIDTPLVTLFWVLQNCVTQGVSVRFCNDPLVNQINFFINLRRFFILTESYDD